MNDAISSLSKGKRKIRPIAIFSKGAHVKSEKEYNSIYQRSISSPEKFWEEKASELHWFRKWKRTFKWDKRKAVFSWFDGGKINASCNCLDRHLEKNADKTAIIWQGESEEQVRRLTYGELYRETCRFANVLKKKGVRKGNMVCVYLPMIPEAAIAMLACARIGAIHSVVFAGFSSEALRDRILDSKCKLLITSDGLWRAGKDVPLKDMADIALEGCNCIKHVIVVKHTSQKIKMKGKRDSYWHDEVSSRSIKDICNPAENDAEDPLFILYTSGTTGKPKGVLHTTGGYLAYVNLTFRWIFDHHDTDVYWCTADIGWITGHSYIIYGPLSNAATILMFEGTPTFPDVDRFWKIIEKFKVTVFYTAPTAIRAVAKFGEEPVKRHNLGSLRLLGTVGEPINPKTWLWYYEVVGDRRCPIVDTWWQTETGGILITPLPGASTLKPGSAGKPFPGIEPVVLGEDGKEVKADTGGYLCIRKPWPGMMRTVYGDHQKFIEAYWKRFRGFYFTGDGAKKDAEGDYWLMGRIDDVIKVSGHRIGTAEVESAIVSHEAVAEAAIVPFPHEIKGQALYAFVTLKKGVNGDNSLKEALRAHVGRETGPIAKPDKIQFVEALPKTRSGKIMRRILRLLAEGKKDVGNITTLADPSVVEEIIKGIEK